VGSAVGEVCFNTAMTGYQEVMTDPSYASQIVTFTFPTSAMSAPMRKTWIAGPRRRGLRGARRRDRPSNFRAQGTFQAWMEAQGRIGISGSTPAR
jgi:carbamoyl-phosphate synthase small subunit